MSNIEQRQGEYYGLIAFNYGMPRLSKIHLRIVT